MMQQTLTIFIVCECGESLGWSFERVNNTVGDDEITLQVHGHKCGEAD